MLKKSFSLLVAAAACFAAAAGELVIAEKGLSPYQIVVPEPTGNKSLDDYVALGGKVIRTATRKASGADVPLVTEAKKIPGKPAIYVGNVKALAQAGLSSQDFEVWEHAVTVKGKEIFCYGKDLGNPIKKSDRLPAFKYPEYFIHFAPGSLKASCVFAEKFLNTRFVAPSWNNYGEHDGVRTRPLKRITLPDDFALRRKVRFFHAGDIGGLLYAVGNNFHFRHGVDFGSHSHIAAVPQEKYYKTHPEYFALIDGKRHYHAQTAIYQARPQYCLSNPEVQELIYKDVLRRADLGLSVVNLGQTDGFIGCQCGKCKKMYNTSDWGEKIWRLHREMAGRLMKDRPGVALNISCYGPTHKAPKSFTSFPGKGVYVHISPLTKQLLEDFKPFNLLGVMCSTYYMGTFKASSFAPAVDFDFLQKEIRWLRSTPAKYLYNYGVNTSLCLNGPWSWAFGKLCEEPDLDTRKLLREYCLFAFGDRAAPEMVKFYELLDKRSKLFPPDHSDDVNDFRKRKQSSDELWQKRYTPEVLAELQKHLDDAEKVWEKSEFTDTLKREFRYLRLTAEVNNAAKALDADFSRANRLALADAIDRRDAFLDALPRRAGRVDKIFHLPTMAHLKAGGYMAGIFQGSFNADPAQLRRGENRAIELRQVTGFADPAWRKIPAEKLVPLRQGMPDAPVSFKAARTGKALLLVCTAPLKEAPSGPAPARDSTKLWQEGVWEIFTADNIGRRQLAFSARPGSAYDARIYPDDRDLPAWNGRWSHRDTVKNGVWRSEVTLPFAALGTTPRPGEFLMMQFAFSTPGAGAIYAWNVHMGNGLKHISGYGKVRFGARSPDERTVDLGGGAQVKKFWKPANPKCFLESVTADGKNAVKGGYREGTWGGISSMVRTALEEDEEAVVTVTLRGRGKAYLTAGWVNASGRFAANSSDAPGIVLSDRPQNLSRTFRLTPRIRQKGGDAFYVNIFLSRPGGEFILQKAELKIRRAK